MSKKNYQKTTIEKPEEKVAAENVEVVEAEVQVEELVEKEEPVVTTVVGVVAGCKKLNVRKAGKPDAEVLCVLNENAEVQIDKKRSTRDFYRVCTAAGVEGFCMKTFITIK